MFISYLLLQVRIMSLSYIF